MLSAYRSLVAVIVVSVITCTAFAQTNLVQNPSFETGAIGPEWNVVSNGSGRVRSVTSADSLYFGAMPAVLAGNGTRQAALDEFGPSTIILYQDIALPVNHTVTAQATVAMVNFPLAGASNFYRVDIVSPIASTIALGTTGTNTAATFGANVLATLLLRPDNLTNVSPAVDTSAVDISAYAGQTVRIRAVVNASTNYTQGILDNVRVIATPLAAPASIPTLSEWALIGLSSLLAMFGMTRMRRRSV